MTTVNIYDMADTWTVGGTTYTAIKMNVTDTASAAASLLMDLQVGGSSKFTVSKTGQVVAPLGSAAAPAFTFSSNLSDGFYGDGSTLFLSVNGSDVAYFNGSEFKAYGGTMALGTNVYMVREAANVLAQRNSTNAQAFRVYNTYTDASNYERGIVSWSSNELIIGTEAAGTGSTRKMRLATGSIAGASILVDHTSSVATLYFQWNSATRSTIAGGGGSGNDLALTAGTGGNVVVTGGVVAASVQSLSGAGAINLTTHTTALTTTGADALTLADGVVGQIKYIVVVSDGGTGTLTPTNLANGTTITFADVGDSVILQFIGTEWHVIANNGAVIA
jgi:hypothetical protein